MPEIGLFQAPRRPWVDNKDRGQTLEVYLCLGKYLLAELNCRANTCREFLKVTRSIGLRVEMPCLNESCTAAAEAQAIVRLGPVICGDTTPFFTHRE